MIKLEPYKPEQEAITGIQELDMKINKETEELLEKQYELNKRQLTLEQDQIQIKQKYEEQGVKYNNAKELAKQETIQQQEEILEQEAIIEKIKHKIRMYKEARKLQYAIIDLTIAQQKTG